MEDPQDAVRGDGQEERAPGGGVRGARRLVLLRGRQALRPRREPPRGVPEAARVAGHRRRADRRLRGRRQGDGGRAGARARPQGAQGEGAREVREQGPRRGRRARHRGRVEQDREARRRADRHPRPVHRGSAGEPDDVRLGAPSRQGRQDRRLAGRAPLRDHLCGDQDRGVGRRRAPHAPGGEPKWTRRAPSRRPSSRARRA